MTRVLAGLGLRSAKLALALFVAFLVISGAVALGTHPLGTSCVENQNIQFGPIPPGFRLPRICPPGHSNAIVYGWQLPVAFLLGAVGLGLIIYLLQTAFTVRRPGRIPRTSLRRLPHAWR